MDIIDNIVSIENLVNNEIMHALYEDPFYMHIQYTYT